MWRSRSAAPFVPMRIRDWLERCNFQLNKYHFSHKIPAFSSLRTVLVRFERKSPRFCSESKKPTGRPQKKPLLLINITLSLLCESFFFFSPISF